jgi:hypothetical protein
MMSFRVQAKTAQSQGAGEMLTEARRKRAWATLLVRVKTGHRWGAASQRGHMCGSVIEFLGIAWVSRGHEDDGS